MVFVPIFYHVWFLKSQPERKNLPGIDPPTKNGSGLDLDKKLIFEDFYKKIFIWERNHPDSSFSDYLWIPDRY